MKRIYKLIPVILILLISVSTVKGQRSPSVTESVENLAGVSVNSLIVIIPEVGIKQVEKAWRSSLTVYGAKIKKSKRALIAQPVTNLNISAAPMVVYSKLDEKGGQVRLVVAFNTGAGYISRQDDPKGYEAAENYLFNFALDMVKQHVAEQMDTADKEMDKLIKKHKDLIRRQEKLDRSIKTYESKIQKAKQDLEQTRDDLSKNESDQSTKKKQLEEIKAKERSINKM
jgi:hypothetical protein